MTLPALIRREVTEMERLLDADSDEAGVRWDEASAIQRGKVPPR